MQTILLLNAALSAVAMSLAGGAAYLGWRLSRRAPGPGWIERLDDDGRLADSA